ncbi:MAG TPA: hypothetical protein VF070_02985 [Streptosporangiaceae bacterium]
MLRNPEHQAEYHGVISDGFGSVDLAVGDRMGVIREVRTARIWPRVPADAVEPVGLTGGEQPRRWFGADMQQVHRECSPLEYGL